MTLPDKITLDQMVRGEVPPEADAWAELLSDAEGARAWSEAFDRRQALDRSAALAWRSPWLAGAWLTLRRAGRRLSQTSAEGLALTLLEPDITLASLGAPEAAPVRTPVTLSWGALRTQAVHPGQRLSPALGEDETLLWRTEAGEGALIDQDWRVEAGEGPVLLLAVRGPRPASVDAALASGQPFAGLLLIPEGETEP